MAALRGEADLIRRDADITAQVPVKHHGQDAPIHAAMRADAMLDKGNLDG